MRTRLIVFVSRVFGWLRDAAQEDDFNTEIQAHLTLATEENVRRGMAPDEAARAARVRLGGVTQLREDQRARSRLSTAR